MSPEEWLASQTQVAPAASVAAPVGPVAAPGMPGARVTATEQAVRNQDALPIFTQELAKAEAQVVAGNPRAVQDVAAIKREMTRQGLPIPAASAPAAAPAAAPAVPAPSPVSPEAWLASHTPAAAVKPPQLGFYEGLVESVMRATLLGSLHDPLVFKVVSP